MTMVESTNHSQGLSPINIKVELDSTLGESAPSFTTVKYWVAEFKRDLPGHSKNKLEFKKRWYWKTCCKFKIRLVYEVCKLSNESGNVAPDPATLRRRDLEERVTNPLDARSLSPTPLVSDRGAGVDTRNTKKRHDDHTSVQYEKANAYCYCLPLQN
ncbi:hypothetical protein NQ318_016611 [Aromia moschata]|uniref:Uncharacterized protein n=1 Tax=Aromia moschata TaxID=1265417 RepID=A0AAV8X230_9CUCU|nr:hypothetical protein NQ318_016611 [Aromia moschata]